MRDSRFFEVASEAIETATTLDRLAARGTLRIALKQAGLTNSVGRSELLVVIDRVLPSELSSRGVGDAGAICERVAAVISAVHEAPDPAGQATPEAVFRRLRES